MRRSTRRRRVAAGVPRWPIRRRRATTSTRCPPRVSPGLDDPLFRGVLVEGVVALLRPRPGRLGLLELPRVGAPPVAQHVDVDRLEADPDPFGQLLVVVRPEPYRRGEVVERLHVPPLVEAAPSGVLMHYAAQ